MKNIRFFLSENFHFLVVKFSVYLNRHVFVMDAHKICDVRMQEQQPINKQGVSYYYLLGLKMHAFIKKKICKKLHCQKYVENSY